MAARSPMIVSNTLIAEEYLCQEYWLDSVGCFWNRFKGTWLRW
ncbi:15159_t:CDS:2 [Acaulospora morrowiae]|uniref:15159_t:CDS:1 n=1 Tax=Acaulospora morrowiae TaxID=94023 RepID=A0A9N9APJ6_9GLOM|nr:15159_t:CDS:2 [Acaulospora morrowiae]